MKRSLLMFALLFLGAFSVIAQEIAVKGVVKDETGTPLPGVTVIIKGTTTGTATDVDGKYALKVPSSTTVLVFSYVGYNPQEITVGTQSTIDVQLETNTVLDEVIVVAYGEVEKKAVTGAIGSVKAEDIKDQQIVSVGRALQGTTPGVNIITSSGQPGANPTIRIRGVASINASAAPLIVLDGVVYNGNLNSISADEIETMNVLKDASAAALYGSRAANGVIVITTKSGKPGKMQLNFNASTGVSQRAVKEYEFVSADEYMQLAWEALRFEGEDAGEANPGQYASDNLINPNLNYNPYGVANPIDANGNLVAGANLLWDTDWESILMRDEASRQDIDLNISGGNENVRYFFSTSYLSQQGLTRTSKFERINTRMNVDAQLNDWLSMGVKTAFSYSDQNFPNQGGTGFANNIQYIRSMANIYPLYMRDQDGSFLLDADGNRQFDFGVPVLGRTVNVNRPVLQPSNLAASTLENDFQRERYITTLNGYMQADFLKYFTFRTNFSLDFYLLDRFDYQNPNNGDGQNVGGRVRRDKDVTTAWTWFNQLSFNRTFGDHTVGAKVISEAYNFTVEDLQASKTSFPFAGLTEFNAAATLESTIGFTNQQRLASILGQVSYNYKGKYFLDVSWRQDGSSRFSKDNRIGTFASIGASWAISDENFMDNIDAISFLKLRGSFGELGNNDLLDANSLSIFFPYLNAFSTGFDDLGNPGIFLGTLSNPDITWETVRQLNIGIDFGLFKDRITGSVEWYNKETENLLFNKPLAASTGETNIQSNIGSLSNKGIEIVLNTTNIRSNGFEWTTSFNISFEKNEITELAQDEIINGTKKWEVGKSIYDFFLQEWAGVDPADGAAMWYKDEDDGSGNITKVITKDYDEATRYFQGSALPDARGGITNRLSYKGIDLSFLWFFSFGGDVLDTDYSALMHGFNNMGNQLHVDIKDRWQQPGDITDVPRLSTANTDGNRRSTRFLYDNTHARLRNITLGYSCGKDLLDKMKVFRSLRVFVAADNLITLSGRDGMDPEQNIQGTTSNRSSIIKSFSAGINIGL